MEKEQVIALIKEYIKEHVVIEVKEKQTPYDYNTIEIGLRFYDEKNPFTSETFDLPFIKY